MATIRKRGEAQWEVQVRKKGWPHVHGTFETKSEAEAWATLTEAAMIKREHLVKDASSSTTMKDAMECYIDEVIVGSKSEVSNKARARSWQNRALGMKVLSDITTADIKEFMRKRKSAGILPATIKLDVAVLSALFSYAVYEWGWLALRNNPCDGNVLKKPKVKDMRSRRINSVIWPDGLESDEINDICRFSESLELPPIIRLASNQAMRPSWEKRSNSTRQKRAL